MRAVGRVWNMARKHQLPPELVLLAAIIAQAREDARRGDSQAADWLRGWDSEPQRANSGLTVAVFSGKMLMRMEILISI